MAYKSAKAFLDKFYTDDEFTRDFMRKVRDAGADGTDKDNEISLKVAADLGYEMTKDEWEAAGEEYMQDNGGFKASLRMVKRLIMLSHQIAKEEKAAKKGAK